jgi:hypothetical protein
MLKYRRRILSPSVKKRLKKRLFQTRSHPRHGDDLGVWGTPNKQFLKLTCKGNFQKSANLSKFALLATIMLSSA